MKLGFLTTILSVLILAGCAKEEKKPAQAPETKLVEADETGPYPTKALAHRVVTLVPKGYVCEAMRAFLESLQMKQFPDYDLITESDCRDVSPAMSNALFATLQKKSGEEVALELDVDFSKVASLDDKPAAVVRFEQPLPARDKGLERIEPTFRKWLAEHALTPREACKALKLDDEACKARVEGARGF